MKTCHKPPIISGNLESKNAHKKQIDRKSVEKVSLVDSREVLNICVLVNFVNANAQKA